jgi:hypothetical protein
MEDVILEEPGQLDPVLDEPVVPDVEDAPPPPPSKFRLDEELEFETPEEASKAFRMLAQEVSQYRNSQAVQEARAQELKAQAEAQRQEQALYSVYQRAAAEAKEDIAAGRLDSGFAKIMHASAQVAKHQTMQELAPQIQQAIQAALELNNSPSEFDRANSIKHLAPYKEQMLELERQGWPRPQIVKFFEGVAKAAPRPQGNTVHLESPDGEASLSQSDVAEINDFEKQAARFWKRRYSA